MADDVFADNFQLNIGPYGCTLSFQLSSPTPPALGAPPQLDRVATVRMTPELFKALAFIMHRQITAYEGQSQAPINLPAEVLRSIQIRQEDWEAFWH